MLLPLKQGILYGPVTSRRYGLSLGINLMPARSKLCSFNCVYCHYGLTRRCTMDILPHADELPAFHDVLAAVEKALRSEMRFDLLTFSGNGEPTLYPRFGELVEAVAALRNRWRPRVRLALLSNSTGLSLPGVAEAIPKLDLPVLKLDAGTVHLFRAINRPAPEVQFDQVVCALASVPNIYIQTVFVDGEPSNSSLSDVRAYMGRLVQIQPREVHLYSIDRPVPEANIARVPPERLERIARQISSDTGLTARAYFV